VLENLRVKTVTMMKMMFQTK